MKINLKPKDIKLTPEILDDLGFGPYWEECGGTCGTRTLSMEGNFKYYIREFPYINDVYEGNNPYGPECQTEHIKSDDFQTLLDTLYDLLLDMRIKGYKEHADEIQNNLSLSYCQKDFCIE